jgi:hypothetical protein
LVRLLRSYFMGLPCPDAEIAMVKAIVVGKKQLESILEIWN